MQDDVLRKLYQGYIASKIPQKRMNCPSPLALFASFDSTTSKRKKAKVIDHVTACSFCNEEFRFLLELQRCQASSNYFVKENSPKSALADDNHTPSSKTRLNWRFAYLLLGLAMVTYSFYMILNNNRILEISRSSKSAIMLFRPVRAHHYHDPLVFSWQKQEAAQYYILELFNNELLPIWMSKEIRDTQFQLPNEVILHLQIGNYYYWMITAYSGSGIFSESDLRGFQVLN